MEALVLDLHAGGPALGTPLFPLTAALLAAPAWCCPQTMVLWGERLLQGMS